MQIAKLLYAFFTFGICITCAEGQTYFNRSVTAQVGWALPTGAYKNGQYSGIKLNYATPGFSVGLEFEAPIHKSLKYYLGARYSKNGFNEQQLQSSQERVIQEENADPNYSTIVIADGNYSNVQTLVGLSYFFDLLGNKKFFLLPKAGVGLLWTSSPGLEMGLYHHSILFHQDSYSKGNKISGCISFGTKLKYYISHRSVLVFDLDFTYSNIVINNITKTDYDVTFDDTRITENTTRIDYRVIHLMLGYSYNF